MTKRLPRWLPDRPVLRARLARVLQRVLCAILVFGLTPGGGAAVEAMTRVVDHPLPVPAAVSTAHDGHDDACDDDCRERGCTPLQHHCKCCTSVAAVLPRLPDAPVPGVLALRDPARYPRTGVHGPQRATPPPVRPPIG